MAERLLVGSLGVFDGDPDFLLIPVVSTLKWSLGDSNP